MVHYDKDNEFPVNGSISKLKAITLHQNKQTNEKLVSNGAFECIWLKCLIYVDNIFIALQFESNYWQSYRMRASSKEM